MRTLLFAVTLIAALIGAVQTASAQTFQGKVWFVNSSDAVHVNSLRQPHRKTSTSLPMASPTSGKVHPRGPNPA